jgi:hypothetical protein
MELVSVTPYLGNLPQSSGLEHLSEIIVHIGVFGIISDYRRVFKCLLLVFSYDVVDRLFSGF